MAIGVDGKDGGVGKAGCDGVGAVNVLTFMSVLLTRLLGAETGWKDCGSLPPPPPR